jgi:hypothetical protein
LVDMYGVNLVKINQRMFYHIIKKSINNL